MIKEMRQNAVIFKKYTIAIWSSLLAIADDADNSLLGRVNSIDS